MPMTTEAISSARPCPNGCSSSAGFSEIFSPMISTIDERLSESVCQASATIAIEPVTDPTKNLNAASAMLPQIAMCPSLFAQRMFERAVCSCSEFMSRKR